MSDAAKLASGEREAQARAFEEYKADLQKQIDDKKRRKVCADVSAIRVND